MGGSKIIWKLYQKVILSKKYNKAEERLKYWPTMSSDSNYTLVGPRTFIGA